MNASRLKQDMLDFAEQHGLDALAILFEEVNDEWEEGDSATVSSDDDEDDEDDEDDDDPEDEE